LALVGVGGALALASVASKPRVSSGDRRVAVAEILGRRGFVVEPADVVLVDAPGGVLHAATRRARVLVRARAPQPELPADEWLSDIYVFRAELTPGGSLLDLDAGHNVSETTGAEETRPVLLGDRAAFASQSQLCGAPSVVTVLDLSGQESLDWPTSDRMKNAVTNWQTTGQVRGFGRRKFEVGESETAAPAGDPGASGQGAQGPGAQGLGTQSEDACRGEEVRVTVADASFVIERGARSFALSAALESGAAPNFPDWIRPEPVEVARPGNLTTWAVDRVRAEIGDENMQAIKQAFFEAKDVWDRNAEEISGATGEEDIAEDMGEELGAAKREIVADPDVGWPPPPLEPWVTPPLQGEGEWNTKEDAAFYRNQPNLPPTFLTTFIRSDRSRKTTRVYVTLWDPRQVELHMMAGTVEPKSATGKAGPGMIPRTADVMKRVVAATNAGFQALHGEYGMMADGIVYLPPKPYAATVMKLRDGSTAFGSWPNDATVPDAVVSYRQNMTVMVEDEKFNPYNRTWWGGTVPGSEDKTHTVRTGICLTKEKFVAYFYGADLSPEALSQAMIQTRCAYGLALDMNAGHSGLEFYKVAPTSALPELGRPLETSWEAEGEVPGMDGYSFRAKRLVKGMGLMNFPRYIKREARDFFYLTLRHVLPGENLTPVLSPAREGEGTWRVKGLPQHGFPYALATTELRPDKTAPDRSFRVLAIDPRMVAPAGAAAGGAAGSGEAGLVLEVGPPTGSSGLFYDASAFTLSDSPPSKSAVLLASGGADPRGVALLAVHPESGMLFYAELGSGTDPVDLAPLRDVFAGLGFPDFTFLPARWALRLGDGTALDGQAIHPLKGDVTRLVRRPGPGGARFFPDTPIVPRDEWYPLQQHRVRYFKKQD
jgi:hypothetical protein